MSCIFPSPTDILPQVEHCITGIQHALFHGIRYANEREPEARLRSPEFWAHLVRYRAKETLELESAFAEDWEFVRGVRNTGVHVRIGKRISIRVRRTSEGTTPAPARTHAQYRYYRQAPLQLALDGGHFERSPINLVLDWDTDRNGDLVLHLGMPSNPWVYRQKPNLAWRIQAIPVERVDRLTFAPIDDGGEPTVILLDRDEAAISE